VINLAVQVEDPDSPVPALVVDGLPPGLSLSGASIVGTIEFTAAQGSSPGKPAGVYRTRIALTDPTAPIIIGEFDWTVLNTNRPPSVTTPPDQTGTEDQEATLAISATDPDGDALTYSASGLPTGLSINAATGLIGGRLDLVSAGIHTVTITVSDGTASTETSFTWTVQAGATTPNVRVSGSGTLVPQGAAFQLSAKTNGTGKATGQFTFRDLVNRKRISAKGFRRVAVRGTRAVLQGTVKGKGVPSTSFTVEVEDLSPKGAGFDRFTLRLGTGYSVTGVLTKGNVRITR
jgi:large repetitive protein